MKRTPEHRHVGELALPQGATALRFSESAQKAVESYTPTAIILRVTLANVALPTLAAMAQEAGLSGFVSRATGFGAWGVEDCAVVESATRSVSEFLAFVRHLLQKTGEKAAYVTVNNVPYLFYDDGRLEPVQIVSLSGSTGGTAQESRE